MSFQCFLAHGHVLKGAKHDMLKKSLKIVCKKIFENCVLKNLGLKILKNCVLKICAKVLCGKKRLAKRSVLKSAQK